MENMFNATTQNNVAITKVSNNDTLSNVSNPIRRNKLVPPPLDGLASREYASAVRALAFAQINLPKYNCSQQYNHY